MIATALVLSLMLQVTSQGSRPGESVRVMRAEVGPKGSPRGDTFVFDEQRDSFNLATDKEITVAFEWDAPPGTHRCELSWIAPDGGVALQARLDLPAKGRRFSGFWSLILNPTMSPGLWAAEVKVDGVAAGSKTFRIVGTPAARPLAPDILYKLASETTLAIEAKVPAGTERRLFAGFAIGDDAVITTFGAINAANLLQVTFSDGSRAQTDEVWLYSRDLDWALLRVAVPATQKKPTIAQTAKVGEPCFFLNSVEGQKELAPCSVTGQNTSGAAPRLTVSNRPSPAAFGAPLLSSMGDVIGMVGIDSVPGGGAFEDASSSAPYRAGSRVMSSALLVMPVGGISRPESGEGAVKLASFWERGLFFKPVTASRHVSSGFVGVGAADPRGRGLRGGSGSEFYSRDGTLTALLTWQPRERVDTTLNHACYDASNRLIASGKPLKIALRPGTPLESSSQTDVSQLKPGEYRWDILLGDEVAWRAYFRIKP